jgi:hypothetical protein
MVSLRDVMVAIAGAEDGYGNAPGDHVAPGSEHWSCNDYTSFGPWQVNLPTWHSLVYTLSGGLTSPCDMASWLSDYRNSALIANRIVNNGAGLHNWTTWWSRDGGRTSAGDGNGSFVGFLSSGVSLQPTGGPPAVVPASATGTMIDTTALLDVALALGGVVLLATLLRRAVS